MIIHTELRELVGADLLDASGHKVGKIGQIYVNGTTGEPGWATVNTGIHGVSETFVPLAQADRAGNAVRVPYEKSTIKDAPNILVGEGLLDESQERELLVYYGLDFAEQLSDGGVGSGQAQGVIGKQSTTQPGAPGSVPPGPTTSPDFSEAQHEVVSLPEERPVEPVRLTKEAVQAVDRLSKQARQTRITTDAGDIDLAKGRRTRNR
jgi:sporulation protein YlmC with PRC-barrel domain